ncbi:MAG: type II secretion system F family protein [Elusimicrobia bacterium]|nr:type II secretion system F family protein [Elusimicrobiota bacterium]
MSQYSYTAFDAAQKPVEGEIAAASVDEACKALQKQGLLVLSVREFRRGRQGVLEALWSRRRVSAAELGAFTRRVAMLLEAGLPLVRCLSSVARQSSNRALSEAIARVIERVKSGASLSAACQEQPHVFPSVLCALLAAGEASGSVVPVLQQYTTHVERQEELRKRLQAALAYPAIVLLVAVGLMVFLSVRVVPTFAKVFESFHLALPAATVAVVALSEFLRDDWPRLLLGLAVAWVSLAVHAGTPEGRRLWCRAKRRLPLLQTLFEHAWHERLLSTWAMLLKSGVSIVTAMDILEQVMEDCPVYAEGIQTVRSGLVQGKTIVTTLCASDFMAESDIEAISSGEESGSLVECLEVLANQHAQELDHFIRRLTAVVEPLMIVVVGAMVGVLLFSLFLPMIELTNLQVVR